MTDQLEAEMREQLTDVFGKAAYPVEDPFDLVEVLPNGSDTTFEAGDVSVNVMDFGMKYPDYQSYPYDDVSGLVDDLMHALRDNNVFDCQ